ncbi:hypothetical protein [Companilactobacillus halodurans]|uniref:DNA-directed RNA polymerase beta subunit n=1 Tax=Companilactobacillus halodurans TaxID=2584183 RepID=A0A5P0ZV27_9LACO|nr:hypothetical protein [Companilactobacillus halodurans]MQS76295.1 hypothetical protein [Companilactobacillus halodurans]MQS96574.1 hypothetical protein [Companilactobacillus halodurans]
MNSKYEADPDMVQAFFDNYYHDRGKMKWQGFYLSDHTAALNRQKKQQQHRNELRPQQKDEQITKLLMQSFTYNQIVKVQLNIVDSNNEVADDLTGEVSGYDNDVYHLDNKKSFHLGDVRNVEIVI